MYNILSLKFNLVQFVLIYSLIILIHCNQNIEVEIGPNNWDNITEGFPKGDEYNRRFYNESTAFYYLFNNEKTKDWIIGQQTASKLDDDQIYKLSFKYWSHSGGRIGTSAIPTDIYIDSMLDHVKERYYIDNVFINKWMPVHYYLSGRQLKNTEITIFTNNPKSLIAFKDIKLEYESENKDIENLDNSLETHQIPDASFNVSELVDFNATNKHYCYVIEFANSDDIELNAVMRVNDEQIGQIFFTIKPPVTEYENTTLCLEDLFLFSATDIKISFNATYRKNMSPPKSMMVIHETNKRPNKTPKVSSEHTFLTPMKDNKKDQWQTQWTEIPLSGNGNLFSNKNDHVQFYAKTKSWIPSSVSLVSTVWIKNDPDLNIIDGQYSITVADRTQFNSFIVRPKVCDWLFHCTDVFETNIEDVDTTRTISFNFSPVLNTTHIKLQFYVEYFKPSYIKEKDSHTVSFGLNLIHFGDPCFQESQCKNSDSCISDPKKDKPNNLICNCDNQWSGEFCDTKNHCQSLQSIPSTSEKNLSGDLYCSKYNNGTDCQNTDGGFICKCPGTVELQNIIWNPKTNLCEPIDLNSNSSWTISTKSSYPQKADNELVYDLKNINTEESDVCFNLTYENQVPVNLLVNYIVEKDDSSLFNISLQSKKPPIDASHQDKINFCVRDFVLNVSSDFKIKFRVQQKDSNKEYNETTFKFVEMQYKLEPIDRTEKRLVKFIKNWNEKQELSTLQLWKSIPENKIELKPDNPGMYYSLKFDTNIDESIDYLLLSEWIDYHDNFNNRDTEFKIRFTNAMNDSFRAYIHILQQNGNTIVSKIVYNDGQNKPRNEAAYSFYDGKFNLKDYNIMPSPFKLLFQFSKTVHKASEKSVDIDLMGFELGDPCFNIGNKCKDMKCLRDQSIPNQPKCECVSDDKIGDLCDIPNKCKFLKDNLQVTNEEFCQRFPNGVCEPLTGNCRCDGIKYKSSNSSCQQNQHFFKHQKTCEGLNCDLIDKISVDTKWWGKDSPEIDEKSLPFYLANSSDDKFTLSLSNFNNFNESVKTCINITYQLSNSNSALELYYNDDKQLELTNYVPNKWISENICLNQLVKNIEEKFNLVLKPRLNGKNDRIGIKINKYDSIKEYEGHVFEEQEYIEQWITNRTLYEKQWPIAYPSEEWGFEDKTNSVQFTPHFPGHQTSKLLSNWIKFYKNFTGYKLRFKISAQTSIDFDLSIEVYDEKMRMVKNPIHLGSQSDLNTKAGENKTIITPINDITTDFRIAFKVVYRNEKQISESIFNISSIDIGDTCVDDNLNIKNCNGHGDCKRDIQLSKYYCECRDNHTKETDCKQKNWCESVIKELLNGNRTGKEYCEIMDFGGCHYGGLDQFSCDCKNDPHKYWVLNDTIKGCFPKPKCPLRDFDLIKQICTESDNGTRLECNEQNGYINVGKDDDIKCEKYNACDAAHRSIMNKDELACKNNSKCIQISEKPIDEKDHKCICEQGYKQSGDEPNYECHPMFCELPTINDCTKSECEYDENGFKCSEIKTCKSACPGTSFCADDSVTCKCRNGEKRVNDDEGNIIGCESDEHYQNANVKSLCPNGEVRKDNKTEQLVCKCGQGFIQSENGLCRIEPLCSEGSAGRRDCDRQNKLCFIDDKEPGYLCKGVNKSSTEECLPGMTQINGADVCVDHCQIDHRDEDCARINAYCDPIAVEHNVNYPDYCKCRPGFVRKNLTDSKFKCVLGIYSVKFNMKIKNTVEFTKQYTINDKTVETPYLADLLNFHKELNLTRSLNEQRLETLTKNYQDISRNNKIKEKIHGIMSKTNIKEDILNTLTLKQCDLDKNYFVCSFTLSLDNQLDEKDLITNKLSQLCVQFNGTDNCFYPALSSEKQSLYSIKTFANEGVVNEDFLMVIDQKSLNDSKPVKYQICSESVGLGHSPCKAPADCHDIDGDTSAFECRCNSKYFENVTDAIIETQPKTDHSLLYQTCKIMSKNDLCQNHCYSMTKDSRCTNYSVSILDYSQKVPVHYVPVICDCAPSLRNDTTDKACVAVCKDIECGDGRCVQRGDHAYACECSEKFTIGDSGKCDKKLNQGGWIAAVAVLAVVVVILAGVAIFFARRKRSLGIESPSTRQLDDFNDNSYRVRN